MVMACYKLPKKLILKMALLCCKSKTAESLPCAKGGAEERGGGIVKDEKSILNNPSVATRHAPRRTQSVLQKEAKGFFVLRQGSLQFCIAFIVQFLKCFFDSLWQAVFDVLVGDNALLQHHVGVKGALARGDDGIGGFCLLIKGKALDRADGVGAARVGV